MSTDSAASTAADDTGEKPVDDTPLGEGGKRALDAERKARREAEQRAKRAEERVHELETQELRREVAAAKGLTEAQAKRLAGSTKEELEADADELLDAFGKNDEPGSRSRPREALENLRSGASNEHDQEPDAGKIADKIVSRTI